MIWVALPLALFEVVLALLVAVCIWPLKFGLQATPPDYFMAGGGALLMAGLFAIWLILFLNEVAFDAAVEVTATIWKLSSAVRAVKTEIDPHFEENSGIRRWKND